MTRPTTLIFRVFQQIPPSETKYQKHSLRDCIKHAILRSANSSARSITGNGSGAPFPYRFVDGVQVRAQKFA
jgi:hypothetical protein